MGYITYEEYSLQEFVGDVVIRMTDKWYPFGIESTVSIQVDEDTITVSDLLFLAIMEKGRELEQLMLKKSPFRKE